MKKSFIFLFFSWLLVIVVSAQPVNQKFNWKKGGTFSDTLNMQYLNPNVFLVTNSEKEVVGYYLDSLATKRQLDSATSVIPSPTLQSVIETGSTFTGSTSNTNIYLYKTRLIHGAETNTASGTQAHAEGNATKAGGNQSHTEGGSNEIKSTYGASSTAYSHAEGYLNTIEVGYSSHVEGRGNIIRSDYVHAEGRENFITLANNSYAVGSHLEGFQNEARKLYSHVEGIGNTTDRDYQHTSGRYNAPRSDAITVIGDGIGTSTRSNIFETYTDSTFTEGVSSSNRFNVIGGGNSFQWDSAYAVIKAGVGSGSSLPPFAGDDYAFVYRNGDTIKGAGDYNPELKRAILGQYSSLPTGSNEAAFLGFGSATNKSRVSIGVDNTSFADSTVILGSDNYVYSQGKRGVMIGDDHQSLGYHTTEIGRGLITRNKYESAIGSWNTIPDAPVNSNLPTDRVFSVGAGTSNTNRYNALELTRQGDLSVPGTSSAASFEIPSGGNSEQWDSAYAVIKAGVGNATSGDDNAIVYREGSDLIGLGNINTAQGSINISNTPTSLISRSALIGFDNTLTVTNIGAVFGGWNTIKGSGSVLGQLNTLNKSGAAIVGQSNITNSFYSTAIGYSNIANAYGEVVLGYFATAPTAYSSTIRDSRDRVFAIGNGTGTTRSSAFEVYNSGDIKTFGNLIDANGDVGGSDQILTSTGTQLDWKNSSDLGLLTSTDLPDGMLVAQEAITDSTYQPIKDNLGNFTSLFLSKYGVEIDSVYFEYETPSMGQVLTITDIADDGLPIATWQTPSGGSTGARTVRFLSTNDSILPSDDIIIFDLGGSNHVVYLPDPALVPEGKTYTIKRLGSVGSEYLEIAPTSGVAIDTVAASRYLSTSDEGGDFTMYGGNWYITGNIRF